jgi:hypothetical protein
VDVFGHHLNLFTLNVTIMVAGIIALLAVHFGFHIWKSHALRPVLDRLKAAEKARDHANATEKDAEQKAVTSFWRGVGWGLLGTLAGGPVLGILAAGFAGGPGLYQAGSLSDTADTLLAHADQDTKKAYADQTRIARRITVVNLIANTLVTLAIIGSVIALTVGNLPLALRLDLGAIVLVALKGIGDFILTWLLIPYAKKTLSYLADIWAQRTANAIARHHGHLAASAAPRPARPAN